MTVLRAHDGHRHRREDNINIDTEQRVRVVGWF